MASRNKKGKLYNLFASNFIVTFFYKPGGEEGCYNDEYYYLVLNDSVFIKTRFIDNAVLMIDSATSMTVSIINKLYDELVKYLKTVDDITILASCIGSGMDFIQACKANDIPAVECPEFSDFSERFYNKYKCYARNDISQYGYYLIALHEESFTKAKRRKPETIMLSDDAFEPELKLGISERLKLQQNELNDITTATDYSKSSPMLEYDDERTDEPSKIKIQTPEQRGYVFDNLIDKLMNVIPNLSMIEKDGPLTVSLCSPNISFILTGTQYIMNPEGICGKTVLDEFRITNLVGTSLNCLKVINIIHEYITSSNPTADDDDIKSGNRFLEFIKCIIDDVNITGNDDNKCISAIDGNPYCKVLIQNITGGTCTYEII